MLKKIIDSEEASKRFDVIASVMLPELSRSYVTTLIKAGSITVNNEQVKPGYKLKENDSIEVLVDSDKVFAIPDIELPILFEDDNVLVINKPEGVISHSRGRYWYEPSVASFVRQKTGQEGDRAGIVHRLDRVTSGVMICAKNQTSLSFLQKQFSSRKAAKEYVAIVEGHMKEQTALIDMPVERNPKQPSTFRVGANGKPSQTTYSVLSSSKSRDRLLLTPKTGRTHQLRVHLKQLGHPIVGDHLYGTKADRLYLHAHKLTLTLPNNTSPTEFTAPIPESFDVLVRSDT